eukprot:346859-Chlamydomonas_euryale.AAC.1
MASPEKALEKAQAALAAANTAGRLDIDWQAQQQALEDCRRLAKHHGEIVKADLHQLVKLVVPAVEALRSTTAKAAMILLQVGAGGLARLPHGPSRPVPLHPFPSHRISSRPIPSCPVVSHPVPSHPVPSRPAAALPVFPSLESLPHFSSHSLSRAPA